MTQQREKKIMLNTNVKNHFCSFQDKDQTKLDKIKQIENNKHAALAMVAKLHCESALNNVITNNNNGEEDSPHYISTNNVYMIKKEH